MKVLVKKKCIPEFNIPFPLLPLLSLIPCIYSLSALLFLSSLPFPSFTFSSPPFPEQRPGFLLARGRLKSSWKVKPKLDQ